jgi:hypothetical protein
MDASIRRYVLPVAALSLVLAGTVLAQQAPPPDRQMACADSAKAHHLSGGALNTFMADCLAGADGAGASQDKGKACADRADAQKLAGDARNRFLRGCLLGS